MKTTHILVAFCFTAASAAHAQVAPSATSGAAGLRYTFRYAETAETYAANGDRQTITPSASVEYDSNEERHPFRMKYSGGYTWNIAGPSYATGVFQRLLLSQTFVWHKWDLMFSDNVGYLPQTPILGFSGIAGTGEPVGTPDPNPPTDESILANTHVVNNMANGELSHQFNRSYSLSGGGSSDILRYPDGVGLDTDSVMANAEFDDQLNVRNRISGTYSFSHYTYPGYSTSFGTNAVTVGYLRQWNRRLNTNVSAGPQWVGSLDPAEVPNSLRLSAVAALNYQFQFGEFVAHYNHGTNGGAGYLLGAEFDAARISLSHEFERRNLTLGVDSAYTRTQGLTKNGVTDAKFAGVQATRRIGEYLTVFANYTAADQTTSSPLYSTALSGLEQIVGFGLTYSPRGTRLVRH